MVLNTVILHTTKIVLYQNIGNATLTQSHISFESHGIRFLEFLLEISYWSDTSGKKCSMAATP